MEWRARLCVRVCLCCIACLKFRKCIFAMGVGAMHSRVNFPTDPNRHSCSSLCTSPSSSRSSGRLICAAWLLVPLPTAKVSRLRCYRSIGTPVTPRPAFVRCVGSVALHSGLCVRLFRSRTLSLSLSLSLLERLLKRVWCVPCRPFALCVDMPCACVVSHSRTHRPLLTLSDLSHADPCPVDRQRWTHRRM